VQARESASRRLREVFRIAWPGAVDRVTLPDKDEALPRLRDLPAPFDVNANQTKNLGRR
jgi:hypothetical protein